MDLNFTAINQAKEYARIKHESTRHMYDGYLPYSFHLNLAGRIALRYISYIPEEHRTEVMQAVYLHDVIEDCRVSYNDLERVFGTYVADLVYAVTNEKGKNRKERANAKYYDGIRAVKHATFVKICDRMANALYAVMFGGRMLDMHVKEQEDFEKELWTEEYNLMFGDLKWMLITKRFDFSLLHENVCTF